MRGRIKELGGVARVILNYLPHQTNRYVSLASLASKLKFKKVTINEVRTALEQLVYFGYLRITKYQRTYKDGTPSTRSGFIIEKVYGYDDKIEMKELDVSLFQPPEERAKIRERRRTWSIHNLTVPDIGDAAATVRLLKSVGVETIQFFFLSQDGKHDTTSIRDMAKLIETAERRKVNLMGRVVGKTNGNLIQLDEVPRSLLPRLLPLAFMAFESSPNNFQVWFALPLGTPIKQRNRIRSRLIHALNPDQNPTGVNGGSYGEMRWPESINQKPKHNSFRIPLTYSSMGHFVAAPVLDAAGLQAPVPKRERPRDAQSPVRPRQAPRQSDFATSKIVPDYDTETSNRHITDATFLLQCIKRGFTKQERRQLLRTRSTKYQQLGEAYFEDRDRFALQGANSNLTTRQNSGEGIEAYAWEQ